eukprot:12486516-Alexandrium_andersonii.AAC.1
MWGNCAWRGVSLLGSRVLMEMLLTEMSKSVTLSPLVSMWRNQPDELRTYSTLLAALKQWLDDQRENQLGEMERVREGERSKQRLD